MRVIYMEGMQTMKTDFFIKLRERFFIAFLAFNIITWKLPLKISLFQKILWNKNGKQKKTDTKKVFPS